MIRVKVDSVATLKLKSEALAFHCRCSETCNHGVTGTAEQRKRQSLVSDFFFPFFLLWLFPSGYKTVEKNF